MPPERDTSRMGQPSAEDQGTTQGQDELAQQLSAMARALEAKTDPDEMLQLLVQHAVHLIPGTEEASLSIVKGRSDVSSRHPTGDLPHLVDDLQTETGQGPCLDAAFENQTVRVPNMHTEQRWPTFAPRAASLGANSMLSFQLYVERDDLGALNLYSRQVNAFDDESEHVGLLFASHAAIAFADAEKVRNLQLSVESRDVIGQAKGILMERYQLTAHQAFLLLAHISQNANKKLITVAIELATTGSVRGQR